jgi:hypothetical protein
MSLRNVTDRERGGREKERERNTAELECNVNSLKESTNRIGLNIQVGLP